MVDRLLSKRARITSGLALLAALPLHAHPINFNTTMSYSTTQPSGGTDSVANWTGADFDAANVGGSGVNADGGVNNGVTNDSTTYVANNQQRQGQTFTTGSNANGYDASSLTVRMAGYTNNTATGSNRTSWNLNPQNGPIIVNLGKVTGTDYTTTSMLCFMAGGTGNPGSGTSANGAGNYLTFNLPGTIHLEPNTTYGFDFVIGNGGANFFEWHGTSTEVYSGGTAYTRAWWGGPITAQAGDRVFQVNMTPSASPYVTFVHPGALHTQADFDRMASKVTANAQPWKADYDILVNSPWAQTWWPSYDVDYIVRGSSGNNYTRSQQDAQAIYELALRWKITGDSAYADKAVQIANVWSGLLGIQGDTNQSLAAGICGYLFASGGEILSTYSGWPATEKQAYKDMMMRVFYPANFDFLWRQHDTFWREGGNTHYRLNWCTANMASMAAIGILCDNRAVYQQAVDFFKYGPNNGRVDRAAWYMHPGGLGQGEEAGRDQGHNLGGWHAMALLCQMAWNQGDDLFGYDNNRVLRAFEYNAKFNLWNDVPYARHQTCDLGYTEGGVSGVTRGIGQYFQYELVYNHYVNVKGLAAPWSKLAADATRPEPRPDVSIHPSQVDWLGLGSLTYSRDSVTTDLAPTGLRAHWSKNQIILDWWGSARATNYLVKRATVSGGPFTQIGTVAGPDLNFTDTNVTNGTAYYYEVTAVTPSGNLDSDPLRVGQDLVSHYTFEGNANDVVGTRHGQLKGGATAPGFTTGFGGGQAVSMNGATQYVQLPTGTGNYQDITLATWVYWTGGASWQRVFDFGSEIEKSMYLTTKNGGGGVEFGITTTKGGNFEGDASYYLRGPALPTNQWVHLAVSINGDTGTLYVNGVPVATKSIDLVDPLFSQPFCYLGRSMWNADAYFNGRIDDFRIYNYGLTGNEIYSLWGQGGSNVSPVFSVDPVDLPNATEDADYSSVSQSLASFASDANGGTLTYSKLFGPSWLTVASNGALSGTPSNSDVGANTFAVRVTDASGATDDATLRITVANTNDAPVWSLTSITKPSVTRDQPYTSFTLAGLASDVDPSATLAYSKASGPAWLTIAADGTLSGTPGVADVGANSFTVRVTDNAGTTADATLTITVLPFEMRASYAFEGNTNDSLGNHNGTATGSPVYGTGRLGQGIVLDGSDDYVTLPAEVASHHDITISTFVYWNGGSNWQRLFDFGNDTSNYLMLTPNSGSGMSFRITSAGTSQIINTTALATGKWVHLAVTLSGDTGTLYVNGVAVATNTGMTFNPGDFKPAVNYLGKSQFADPLFNGRIDDFRIYNYALDAATIADISNPIPEIPNGLTAAGRNHRIDLTWKVAHAADTYTVKRSTTAGGPYTTVASGITALTYSDTGLTNGTPYYYVVSATNEKGESVNSAEISTAPSDLLVRLKFDETSGTTAADASGNGNTGTTVNSPTWISGQFNNAINLTNTSSQYVTMPTGVVTGVDDFTVSAWVKMTSLATWARLFDLGTGTTNYMFLAPQGPTANRIRFAIRTPSVSEQQINSTINTPVGAWFHVAVTLTGSTGRLYINGVEAGSNTGMTLKPSSLGTTNLNYLGKSQFSADSYLNGAIDDFRIYGRAFSATEITALSTVLSAPSGLAATAGSGQVALTWNAVSSASSYSVKRATTSGGTYTTVQTDLASTSFTDTGLTNGTTYYYVVSASNLGGESVNSAEASATPLAPPAVPDGLLAIAGDSTVSLEWTAASGADSYKVKRATTPGGPYTTLASGLAATSYTDTAVSNGTAYYYVVSGVNAVAESANSGEVSAMPSPPVPSAPATLTDTPGNAMVALVWSAADGANSYNVKRATNSGGPYATLASGLTATTYNDTSAVNETTYYYIVTASNLGGESESSPEVSATPVTPPVAPAGLAATAGNAQATLTWSAVSGATGYNVKRATVSGGPYATVASGLVAPGFTDTGLSNGTTYYYVVSATNAGGESANSTQVSAAPVAPPAAPTGLAATAGNAQVALTWSSVSGATSYNVKRSTVSGGSYTVVASNLASPSYTDTGLTNGTTYYYVVNATNTGGTSADSSEVSAVPNGLPSPWVTADIGTTGLAGNATFNSNAYTVQGAGSFGGTTDGFRYVYQPLSADGSIIARISTLGDTGGNARVGIMMRDTLANNARMAALSVTGSGSYKWERRVSTGGSVSNTNGSSGTAPNLWVRLVRVGNTITASRSTNGTTWTTIGSATVTLASSCYIGIAVSSGSTTTLNTSVFDNVTAVP